MDFWIKTSRMNNKCDKCSLEPVVFIDFKDITVEKLIKHALCQEHFFKFCVFMASSMLSDLAEVARDFENAKRD